MPHANSALSPDMVTAMEAAKAKIIDGSITVPTVPK
jgi:basic membrane lipoprotein Med (substrate-binding protein (PBP1-ABC) superfamily)